MLTKGHRYGSDAEYKRVMKRAKLKFRPTPISRLSKQKYPTKMVGDPDWHRTNNQTKAWANRERKVYDHEMERKNWPMAWKPETYNKAWDDNIYIDDLTEHKFDHYASANEANRLFDWLAMRKAADRDNDAWDYHHENYLEEVS